MTRNRNPRDGIPCEELVSGRNLAGIVRYSEQTGTHCEVYSFGEFFVIPEKSPIALRLGNGRYATLLDNIGSGTPGRLISESDPPLLFLYQSFYSNTAIIGRRVWGVDDRIAAIHFEVPSAWTILWNPDKIRLAVDTFRVGNLPDSLIHAPFYAGAVDIYYGAQVGLEGDVSNLRAYFEIRFNEPQELGAAELWVARTVAFFALSLGRELNPCSLRITSSADRNPEDTAFREPFDLILKWHNEKAENDSFGHPPFRCACTEDLTTFADQLSTWLNRAPSGDEEMGLMNECFSHAGTISGDRLLTACRWLEAIPEARPLESIPAAIVNSIVQAAQETATIHGAASLLHRIPNALAKISQESHRARFERIVRLAFDGIAPSKSHGEIVADLLSAIRLRGRTAHGTIYSANLQEVSHITSAVEALCTLLTASRLRMSKETRSMLAEHPLVTQYIHSSRRRPA